MKYLNTPIVTGCLLTLVFPFHAVQAAISFQLQNFIVVDSLEELVLLILNILITLAIPIIVLFIIYAGFLYVTARGDVKQTSDATRALTYAVIGAVLALGAVTFAEIIKNLVNSFR